MNLERHDGANASHGRSEESDGMKHAHDGHYVYSSRSGRRSPFCFVLGVVFVVIALAADWLNGLPVQIVGPVLYPIERLLNAAFFPDAQTPLRPNGSALLVLLPTVALFAAIYFAARAMFRAALARSPAFRGASLMRALLSLSLAAGLVLAARDGIAGILHAGPGAMASGRLFRSSLAAWRSGMIRFDLAGSARREQFQAAACAPSGAPAPGPLPQLRRRQSRRVGVALHDQLSNQARRLDRARHAPCLHGRISFPGDGVKIKVCPMRLAMFEADRYALVIDGAACFLEKQPEAPIEDSSATRTEVSYDVTARAFKIRYTVSHMEIPQCAQTVPLHPAN